MCTYLSAFFAYSFQFAFKCIVCEVAILYVECNSNGGSEEYQVVVVEWTQDTGTEHSFDWMPLRCL